MNAEAVETRPETAEEQRKSPLRLLVLSASVVTLVAAFVLVPLPLLELSPGPALDVPSRLRVDRQTSRVSGKLLLTSVSLSRPTALDAVNTLLHPHHQLLRPDKVVGQGLDEQQYLQFERQQFQESVQEAAAVAFRAAGEPVQVSGGGVQVAAVIKGSPAEGALQLGDVITAVDGQPVQSPMQVRTAAETAANQRRRLTLKVQRGGESLEVQLQPRAISAVGGPAIGVFLRTSINVVLPYSVKFEEKDIAGSSAGLMIALSVFDLVSPVDLTRGRAIAGTGSIDIAGNVGAIGGIQEKVVGAERAGAKLFLAPDSQAQEARAAASVLQVVGVRTFNDAVRALETGAPGSP